MIRSLLKGMGAAALLAGTVGIVHAQTFPVRLCTGAVGVCDNLGGDNLTATRMSVDPASGRVTLENVTGLDSLPGGAAGLANIALSVPPGPHESGSSGIVATVTGIPAGASCMIRAASDVEGSGLISEDGWSEGTSLCTTCSPTVTRTLTFTNLSVTAAWRLRLNVQCSVTTSNGYTVSAPPVSSNEATVDAAEVAVGDCPYGENVPTENHDGLTIASRQTLITTSNGGYGNNPHDAHFFSALFGESGGGTIWWGGSPVTVPVPGPTAEGYGYPGSYGGTFDYNIQTGKFIAMKFRAPNAAAWKGVTAQVRSSNANQNGTAVAWSIAPCPGQFRSTSLVTLPAACVVNTPTSDQTGVMAVVSDPAQPYTGPDVCPIEMGKTYYLNIISTDPLVTGNLGPTAIINNSWCQNTSSCTGRMARYALSFHPTYH